MNPATRPAARHLPGYRDCYNGKDEIIAEGRRLLAEKRRRRAEAPSAAGDDQGAAVE